jgi:hypothetical protein
VTLPDRGPPATRRLLVILRSGTHRGTDARSDERLRLQTYVVPRNPRRSSQVGIDRDINRKAGQLAGPSCPLSGLVNTSVKRMSRRRAVSASPDPHHELSAVCRAARLLTRDRPRSHRAEQGRRTVHQQRVCALDEQTCRALANFWPVTPSALRWHPSRPNGEAP